MALAQTRNIDQWNRTKRLKINPCSHGQLICYTGIYNREIYNDENAVSSVSGAWKTGQIHANEWN